MGKADFYCEMSCEKTWENDSTTGIKVHCKWGNNGWTYDISGVYGWVTCNGEERCVYDNQHLTFKSTQHGTYELGSSEYTLYRGHSGYDVSCSARLKSTSSYVSGERYSSSSSLNIPAKKHTIITYNANGGTGAPGNQDKWYGEQLWISGTRPSRTGYNFTNWSASSGGTYNPGQEYTADPTGTVTMTANWSEITYTVSYNANGGSGAPGNQTKRYTANLTLSSTKPTRTGYIFKGWATSASGAVAYSSGGTYSNNSNITLYAVWEVAYKKPTINNFKANRCNSAGTASDTGTYVKVTFDWTTFNNMTQIQFRYKKQTDTSWTTINIKGSQTGKSGSVSVVTGANNISAANSYDVQVYVTDGSSATDATTTYSDIISIGTQKFPIDVKKGASGVAFGKVAERDDALDIGFKELWIGGIKLIWIED